MLLGFILSTPITEITDLKWSELERVLKIMQLNLLTLQRKQM